MNVDIVSTAGVAELTTMVVEESIGTIPSKVATQRWLEAFHNNTDPSNKADLLQRLITSAVEHAKRIGQDRLEDLRAKTDAVVSILGQRIAKLEEQAANQTSKYKSLLETVIQASME